MAVHPCSDSYSIVFYEAADAVKFCLQVSILIDSRWSQGLKEVLHSILYEQVYYICSILAQDLVLLRLQIQMFQYGIRALLGPAAVPMPKLAPGTL